MATGITGAKGFIGSHLTRHLAAAESDRLRLLVRNTGADEAITGTEIFRGDLLSPRDCEQFAAGLSLIYYLAHTNTPVDSDVDLPKDALINLVPFLNLLGAIERLGTKPHVVYFSSGGSLYGPNRNRIPYRETDPCLPLSSYAIQKLAAENYLQLAAHKGDLSATVLRIGNAYGALLPPFRMQGLIGVAINNVLHGRPVRVFGSLNNVRDYIHLDDLCAVAKLAAAPRRSFTVVNVGSGLGHSVAEVLDLIRDSHGGPLEFEQHPELGLWLPDWIVLDITKAKEELGWRPTISLRSGIERMMAKRRHEITVAGSH